MAQTVRVVQWGWVLVSHSQPGEAINTGPEYAHTQEDSGLSGAGKNVYMLEGCISMILTSLLVVDYRGRGFVPCARRDASA